MNNLIKCLVIVLVVLTSITAAVTITYYNSHVTLPGMTP